MIEIGWGEIIGVSAAVMTPLLGVIKILYDGKEAERIRADKKDDEWIAKYDAMREKMLLEYNAMRDRMQEKIDTKNVQVSDAISTVTAALGSMREVISQISKERADESKRLVDDIAAKVKEVIK